LTMLTLAYEEILIESWKRLPSAEAQRQYLLNAYIRRQMTREINQQWYTKGKEQRPEQIRHWLAWLAKKMEAEDFTEFSLGKLSPRWLVTEQQQQMYQMGIKLITGLIFGLILGLVVGAIAGGIWGLLVPLLAGIIGGLFVKIPAIEKFMLRVVLWRHGYIPWNYRRFLNYASEVLLLRRLGDKYWFIHDLLQKHFAEM